MSTNFVPVIKKTYMEGRAGKVDDIQVKTNPIWGLYAARLEIL
jgi:hypothetical protein